MSCVDAEKVSESALDVKNGKPCIDFQPGDRWQIKEDPDEENVSSSKNKDVTCSNGRRSLRLRSASAKGRDATVANGESSENEISNLNSNNASRKPHTELSETDKVSSKRKISDVASDDDKESEEAPDKKIKAEEANSTSIVEEGEKDVVEKEASSEDVDEDVDGVQQPSPDQINNKLKDVKKENDEVLDDVNHSVDQINNKSNVKEEKNDEEEEAEAVQQINDESNTVKKENDDEKMEAEIIEISPEKKSNSTKKVIDDAEIGKTNDDDIQIIDDKKSEEDECDIQILDDSINAKPDTTSFETVISTETDVSLTAGFPYYNSLKEKISNFKAGDYKPVKFPHTGTLLLAENEVIIESPSLLVPLLIKESDQFPKLEGGSEEKKPLGDNNSNMMSKLNMISKRNFFQSSVGQFLINLGSSRVQEWYHRDMKRAKKKQLKGSKANQEDLGKVVEYHDKRHRELITVNAVFNFRMLQCKFCGFKSESKCVMESHYLKPHMSPRREYRCNFCNYLTRSSEEIIFHFEALHGKKAVLEPDVSLVHECIFCSFQTNLKAKVNVHMNRCRKHFIPSQNLAPPFDFEFPGVTTKPVTITDVVGHRRLLLSSAKNRMPMPEENQNSALARKKLASVLSKISGSNAYGDPKTTTLMSQLMKSQNQIPTFSTSANIQLPPGIVITRPRTGPIPQVSTISRYHAPRNIQPLRGTPPRRGTAYTTNITSTAANLASSGISITPITRASLLPRSNTVQGIRNVTLTPISTASNQTVSAKPGPPQPVALFTNMAGSPGLLGQPQARLPVNVNLRPIRPVVPYQRLNTPPSQVVKGSSGNTFVVCEICDAYIKDLEDLRSHMNQVHKVKIHPKMLVSRPPLNCQKCQWRFFTDQGLERHLLGAHGLVTTNMQEMANKNQDGGRCIICGAVFTYKLVSHMTQVHKVTLKPAHLSYKCTVCTATFTLYRLFESHVYNVHSGSAKRPAEESSPAEPPPKKVAEEVGPRRCRGCKVITDNMAEHLIKAHLKNCAVKLCRIEKCKKCLYSSDEMIVIRMSDFGLDSEEDDDSGDDSGSSEDDEDEEEKGKNSGDNSG